MKHLFLYTTLSMLISLPLLGMENTKKEESEIQKVCKKLSNALDKTLFTGPSMDDDDRKFDTNILNARINLCNSNNIEAIKKFSRKAQKEIENASSAQHSKNGYTVKTYYEAKNYADKLETLLEKESKN